MPTNKSRMLKSIASRSIAGPSSRRSAVQSGEKGPTRTRPPPGPQTAPLRKLKPQIVYEDAKQLVLNKPAGVALQGMYGSKARLMWDQLLDDVHARPTSPVTFGVHRLDKSTSGTLLLAKTSAQAKNLAQQFAARQVSRTYLSVVHGCIKPGFAGEITTNLRVDDDLVRSCEDDDQAGVGAVTKWECLSTSASHSLLALRPSTGRKHQLRVHAADTLKAPIVGDHKYAPNAPHKTLLPLPNDVILLHAATVQFYTYDRTSGKRQTVVATAAPASSFTRFCALAGLRIPSQYL